MSARKHGAKKSPRPFDFVRLAPLYAEGNSSRVSLTVATNRAGYRDNTSFESLCVGCPLTPFALLRKITRTPSRQLSSIPTSIHSIAGAK
jgi:hypothetical protein